MKRKTWPIWKKGGERGGGGGGGGGGVLHARRFGETSCCQTPPGTHARKQPWDQSTVTSFRTPTCDEWAGPRVAVSKTSGQIPWCRLIYTMWIHLAVHEISWAKVGYRYGKFCSSPIFYNKYSYKIYVIENDCNPEVTCQWACLAGTAVKVYPGHFREPGSVPGNMTALPGIVQPLDIGWLRSNVLVWFLNIVFWLLPTIRYSSCLQLGFAQVTKGLFIRSQSTGDIVMVSNVRPDFLI